jgi:anionic cell wall polymer biosynthesis LytR-Cps2A-Psr (LCP) family protein
MILHRRWHRHSSHIFRFVLSFVLVSCVFVDGVSVRADAPAQPNQRDGQAAPQTASQTAPQRQAKFDPAEVGTNFDITSQVTRPITYVIPSAVKPLELPAGTINVALLGVDTRPQFKYKNTDVIVIASINPDIPAVTMLSIPRDTLVYIPRRYVWKVNQAYAIGGFELFKKTILYNFGIQVDHYAMVNFEALVHTVDLLGSVDVVATCPIYHVFPRDPYYIGNRVVARDYIDQLTGEVYPAGTLVPTQTIDLPKPGVYSLNGLQALAYVRARKGIPGGDVDRGRREIRMIRAIFAKAKQLGTVTKIPDLLTRFDQDLQTDFALPDLLSLAGMANNVNDAVIRSRFLDKGGNNGQAVTDATIYAGGVSNAFWRARRDYLQDTLTVALNQRVNESIPIEVINGTSDAGFAAAAADRLNELGFRVTEIKAASEPTAESSIVDHTMTRKGSAVPLLTRSFDIKATNVITDPQPEGVRYSIVVGPDFNTCYYAKSLQASGSAEIDTFGAPTEPEVALPDTVDVTAPFITPSPTVLPTVPPTPEPVMPTALPTEAPIAIPTVGVVATPEPTLAPPTPAPTQVAAATLATGRDALVIVPRGDVVNVRLTPSIRARIIGKLTGGQQAVIIGRSTDGAWLEVRVGRRVGWVARSVVQVTGDVAGVPVGR